MNWRPVIMFVLSILVVMSGGFAVNTIHQGEAVALSDADSPGASDGLKPALSFAYQEFTIAGTATVNLLSDIQVDTAEPIGRETLMIVLSANDSVEPDHRYFLSVRDQDGNPLAIGEAQWSAGDIPGGLVTIKLNIPNLTSQYDQLFIALRK